MAKGLGSWGTVASFQLGGVIGCGLALAGIVFFGWAPLAGVGIAMVTGAVAGVFINAIDKAHSDFGAEIGKAEVRFKEDSMPYRAAKKGTDFMKTTAGKVVTGAAVVTLAGSVVVSSGTQTDIPNSGSCDNAFGPTRQLQENEVVLCGEYEQQKNLINWMPSYELINVHVIRKGNINLPNEQMSFNIAYIDRNCYGGRPDRGNVINVFGEIDKVVHQTGTPPEETVLYIMCNATE